tara:strand:- start:1066 stop:1524 length:459 start_codon:yes stop_codon:yes gene_type:complete
MKKLLIVIFLLTISCTNNKVVKNHGLTALEIKANKIKLLKSNKNDVLNIIGKPSTVSLFDENSWFYIGREKVNQSVFKLGKSKIEKNNVLEVTFNTNNIVETINFYKLEDMNKLKVEKNTTVKKYDTKSSFGKALKSIEQKINSTKKNSTNR